jgi:hypothetical protein
MEINKTDLIDYGFKMMPKNKSFPAVKSLGINENGYQIALVVTTIGTDDKIPHFGLLLPTNGLIHLTIENLDDLKKFEDSIAMFTEVPR